MTTLIQFPGNEDKYEDELYIYRSFNQVEIKQRKSDGYFDLTALCKAEGKLFADLNRTESFKAFTGALSQNMGIPIVKLVEVKEGRGGGTWGHQKVAIKVASWCSPEFEVMIIGWVEELMTKGHASIQPMSQSQILLAQAQLLVDIEQRQKAAEQRQLQQEQNQLMLAGVVKSVKAEIDEVKDALSKYQDEVKGLPPVSIREKMQSLANSYATVCFPGVAFEYANRSLWREVYERFGRRFNKKYGLKKNFPSLKNIWNITLEQRKKALKSAGHKIPRDGTFKKFETAISYVESKHPECLSDLYAVMRQLIDEKRHNNEDLSD